MDEADARVSAAPAMADGAERRVATVRLRIGDYLIEPDLDRIHGPGGDTVLEPKVMAVLVYLARRPGEVVSADELIDVIWHGRPMGDNPVYRCIALLRRALGDDPRAPRCIATVPTKGYRLIAAVEAVDRPRCPHAQPAPATASTRARRGRPLVKCAMTLSMAVLALLPGIRPRGVGAMSASAPVTLAVLPFVDMSGGPGQQYFSDGLTEEVISELAALDPARLTVIARTSAMAYRNTDKTTPTIGRELGVAYLLEGSVRRDGDRLRIGAKLIRVGDGALRWSRSYDRGATDSLAIQHDIAQTIGVALQLTLVARPPASRPIARQPSPRAYDLYRQARALMHERSVSGVHRARALLGEALALEPDFAPAIAASALATLLGDDQAQPRALALVRPSIERALALDPGLAEGHAVHGLMYMLAHDAEHAEAALTRAVALDPSLSDALNWQASLINFRGRLRESLAARRHLARIDPKNMANLANLDTLLLSSGALDEAAALARRLRRDYPDSVHGSFAEIEVNLASGRLADAAMLATAAGVLQDRIRYLLGDFAKVAAEPASPWHARALLAQGQADAAIATALDQAVLRPDDPLLAYNLLYVQSLAGRPQAVLRLYRERWGSLPMLEAFFGNELLGSELALIAQAQRDAGQDADSVATLAFWHERIDYLMAHGYAGSAFASVLARYRALAGAPRAAVATLAHAIDLGYRDPLLEREPAFADLREAPGFRAQAARMHALIAGERSKLAALARQ